MLFVILAIIVIAYRKFTLSTSKVVMEDTKLNREGAESTEKKHVKICGLSEILLSLLRITRPNWILPQNFDRNVPESKSLNL